MARPPTQQRRGYPRLYVEHVLQARKVCDFDLRPDSDAALHFVEPTVSRR